jgi:hypothetical protein
MNQDYDQLLLRIRKLYKEIHEDYKHDSVLKLKYADIYEKFEDIPKAMRSDPNFMIKFINMINRIKKIKEGNSTFEKENLEVGQEYFEEYVTPKLEKANKK